MIVSGKSDMEIIEDLKAKCDELQKENERLRRFLYETEKECSYVRNNMVANEKWINSFIKRAAERRNPILEEMGPWKRIDEAPE